jgi:Fe2+ or Zn2+ uptake regulation protein
MERPAEIDKLTPRQAKVLRYIVSSSNQPVTPDRVVIQIQWSDLPHTDLQARKALDVLRRLKLVERVDKSTYTATRAGQEVIKYANKEGLWRKSPPLRKTNKLLHTEKEKGKQDK